MNPATQEREAIIAYLNKARDEALHKMKRSKNALSQRNWAATATAAAYFSDAISHGAHLQGEES